MTQPNQTKTVRRVDVRVQFHPDRSGSRVVGGYSTVEGLAVHRVTYEIGTPSGIQDWNVTHLGSGRRVIGPFVSKAQAMEEMDRIGPMVDWTEPMGSKVYKRKGLGKKVRGI